MFFLTKADVVVRTEKPKSSQFSLIQFDNVIKKTFQFIDIPLKQKEFWCLRRSKTPQRVDAKCEFLFE